MASRLGPDCDCRGLLVIRHIRIRDLEYVVAGTKPRPRSDRDRGRGPSISEGRVREECAGRCPAEKQ